MTNQGLHQALDFLAGVCPAQEQSEQMVKVWRLKLDRFDDRTVMRALWDLAEQPRLRIDVGEIIGRALDVRNRDAIARDAERRELTQFGGDTRNADDRRWNALPAAEQQQWISLARSHWPDWLDVSDDSPLLKAHAAALARQEATR